MVKVLVTGASGFIGSHLTEALLGKGFEVKALVRSPKRRGWLEGLEGIEIRYGALEDPASLERAVDDVDIVYHIAGVVKARNSAAYFQVNAQGTQHLLDAVMERTDGLTRFVYVSSQAVSGPSPRDVPLTETAPPRPITPYGQSKGEGEKRVLALKDRIPVTVIRPPAVYGPRDSELFHYFKLAAQGVVPIPGFGRRQVSLAYVTDLVQGLLLAGESPQATGETFFITSGDHDWDEIAKTLKGAMGRGKSLRVPVAAFYGVALLCEALSWVTRKPAALSLNKAKELTQPAWLCSSDLARDRLGYRSAWPLERGIESTAAWYRQVGWI
jgi:nucleoside-diphosphate-sugar epimerase